MKPLIAIDANPIISALIGGFSREILFDHNFDFITTEFTMHEVMGYISYISKKTDLPPEFFKSLIDLLPIKVYSADEYEKFLSLAETLIKDKKDIHILALTLAKTCPLWSNDAHFEGIKTIKLIKTKDFV